MNNYLEIKCLIVINWYEPQDKPWTRIPGQAPGNLPAGLTAEGSQAGLPCTSSPAGAV